MFQLAFIHSTSGRKTDTQWTGLGFNTSMKQKFQKPVGVGHHWKTSMKRNWQ